MQVGAGKYMKKLFVVVVIVAVLWLAKLSFDLFQVNAQQTELMQQQTLLQQRNAGLNDQVVALKRQLQRHNDRDVGCNDIECFDCC